MRALHTIDTLWLGGAQTILKSLFEKQAANYDIFLFSLRKTNPQIEISHKNVKCFNSKYKLSIARIFSLKKFIKTNNIDVLHCHLPHSQTMGYLMKKLFFSNIKLVFHEHAEIYNKGKILPFLIKKYRKKVDVFISCSEASKQMLHKKTNVAQNKIIVLNNFVDIQKFNTDFRDVKIKEELKIKGFIVGFAGRIIERKGWRELIEAATILKNNTDIKFLIVGVGPDQNKMIRKIEQHGLNDTVFYKGYMSDMKWFYSIIDCFVLPSYWEGLAMVQLESMALGIPLICSDAPGVNEVPENKIDSLFVKPKSGKDLANKISVLKNNSELYESISEKAKNKATFYSIENYLKSLNNIYRNTLYCI